MFAALALFALSIEALAGYPQALLRSIGHPVIWIGALIERTDRDWNVPGLASERLRLNGVLALAIVLLVTLSVSAMLVHMATLLPGLVTLLIVALLASTLLAQRSLHVHVAAVAAALETQGLEAARTAVAEIVGRDPASLDESGVARAAVESLAENFSDGVVAPAFWLAVAGLPGAALYKATNTADSMIGHLSERYSAFGWAAARLDDLVNLPASRLSAVLIAIAAWATHGRASAEAALKTVREDAHRHRSPNAGWPEAAMAGALGLKLAGPRNYSGKTVLDHWMGSGRPAANAADIRQALRLYRAACLAQMALLAVIAVISLLI